MVEWPMSVTPFFPCPVTGDAFIGRQGLVRNLRGRLMNGESVAVIGGPKLGKTSLVRSSLADLPDHRVIEVDLRQAPPPNEEATSGAMLVLDNLDHLSDEAIDRLLRQVSIARPRNLILTGSRRLRTVLDNASTLAALSIRLYPLSVLLDGELRRLVGHDRAAPIAKWTGNHPYLSQLFLHYGEAALSEGRPQWEPFVRGLAEEIGEGAERRLLNYLITCGRPVNPTKAGAETGIEDIKAVADRLVYLGAVSRWIRQDEATLFAGCRLLNDFLAGDSPDQVDEKTCSVEP